ncbi:MAG: hypothetical protein K5795_02605 [Lachnospiraceae bacterium]|nr:hypothetical protein [Lachnospiraceae bacterium]
MANDQDNKHEWTMKEYAWAVFLALLAFGLIVTGIYNIAKKVSDAREEEYYKTKCLAIRDDCSNKRVEGSLYCKEHKCVLATCTSERTDDSEYCFIHAISYDKAYVENHKELVEFYKKTEDDAASHNGTSSSGKSSDSSSSKNNNSTKGNGKSSGKKSGNSSKNYNDDPYDIYDYHDPEDFADEWEEDFDDWEDAYEYWEESR